MISPLRIPGVVPAPVALPAVVLLIVAPGGGARRARVLVTPLSTRILAIITRRSLSFVPSLEFLAAHTLI